MNPDSDNNGDDGGDKSLLDAVHRETSSASEEASAAVGAVKEQARQAASTVADKASQSVESGVESGKAFAASNLEDFAAAIRKASEELGGRDQSMISNLVREAASGLEQASRSVKGASLQDITQSVASFARRQPGAFLVGAGLVGVALGRFARASDDHHAPSTGHGVSDRSASAYTGSQGAFAAEPSVDPSLSGSSGRASWAREESQAASGAGFSSEASPTTGDDYVR